MHHRKPHSLRSPLAVAISLSIGVASLPAIAQTDNAVTLETLRVEEQHLPYQIQRTTTATRTETPLVNVPQSVSVVTEELIEDQAMQNMADVVRYVPGVQMAQGEGHRDAPVLRGTTSTADFFVDGMRDDVQYLRDLYNVEHVEVLKGPSGMIFGRGATGGLINRVTKQANWSDVQSLGVTLGSWENRRATGDFNQALSDTVAFRVTGLYEDSNSFRDYVELERWAVNPTMSFRLSEATLIEVGYEHFEDDRVVDRGVPSHRGSPLNVDESTFFGNADLSYASARVDAFNARITHQFGNGAKLVNTTRYADYEKFYQNVYPSGFDGVFTATVGAYNNATDRLNLYNQTDFTFSTVTGQINHSFLVGLELGRQETENFRQTGYFPTEPTATRGRVSLADTVYRGPVVFRQSTSDADNRSVAETAAIYVQDQLEFSPQWQAILGLRYDRFDVDISNYRNGQKLSSSDDLLSPRVGLIYKPQDNVSLYASYSLSYVPRAGEQLAGLSLSNRALDPEEFTNREVGVKWDLADTLSATAALYQLDQTDVAVTDPNNPARSILVDGQRVRGLELSLAGSITDAWQVMGGYAYQDSEIEQPGANNGNEAGQVPRHSFSLWNRYDFTQQWGAGLGVIYQSDVYVSTDNAVELPSFTRVDAALFYAVNSSVRLQLNVENLFDKGYYASAHNNHNISPGTPRAFRLSAHVEF